MSYGDVLPIWWSFMWRSILGGLVAGAVLGFVAGLIFGLAGRPDLGGPAGGILGFLGGTLASLWALRSALIRHNVSLRGR